jgi:type II secretory pathway pseudopilin PulG
MGRAASCEAFTLMELALVMGVIGMILAGVWGVASIVIGKNQLRAVQEQIITSAQNIRDFYAVSGAPIPTGNTTATLDGYRLFPTEMRVTPNTSGGPLMHAMAGSFTVAPISTYAASVFRFQLAGLTMKNCVNLLMSFPFLTPELGVAGVTANGTGTVMTIDLTNIAHPGSPDLLPFTLSTAQSWCSKDIKGTGNEVDIDFWVRH